MTAMSIYIAERFAEKGVVFIGDGEAIALSVMHLTTQASRKRAALVRVLDVDERIVKSIVRFADKQRMDEPHLRRRDIGASKIVEKARLPTLVGGWQRLST